MTAEKSALVAMSGGVDSAVAALLLKNAGYDTSGITLRLKTENAGGESPCCTTDDIHDAEDAAKKIGIRHSVLDFTADFEKYVVRPFAESYINGDTPNPCVACNRHIKFRALREEALRAGFPNIATGHYARVKYDAGSGRYLLMKAADRTKDQSYVLYTLGQDVLSAALFPVGGLKKGEVREIADAFGLLSSHRPDSQDICFIPDGDYRSFIEKAFGYGSRPGCFIDMEGKVLGTHKGLIGYTTGQRRGLGISAEHPLYVVGKDLEKNTVVLGRETDLYSQSLVCRDVNFIPFDELTAPVRAEVKIRYSQKTAPARLSPLEGGRVLVEFDEKQRAVTSGQSAVFYDGDTVVGGGRICAL